MNFGRLSPHFFDPSEFFLFQKTNFIQFLDEQSYFFSLGSCFSVNFIKWLSLLNQTEYGISPYYYFNSSSILRELNGIVTESSVQHYGWEQLDQSLPIYIDGYRHNITACSRLELKSRQNIVIDQLNKWLNKANAFLFTLGLSVVWEEYFEGRWEILNSSPPKGLWGSNNFRIRYQRVSEIKSDILNICRLIKKLFGEKPIVFSVSPIPLKASFTGEDVRTATLLSKSALITALNELKSENSSISFDYFPAFEYFWLLGEPQKKFQSDGRHPTAEAVQDICLKFCDRYAKKDFSYAKLENFQIPRA